MPARQDRDHLANDMNEPVVSLSHIVRVLKRYRVAMVIALAAVMIAYGIVAVTTYITAPAQRVTSLPFRLDFSGASEGKYPNGTKFSTSDILGTPILLRVYEQNGLREYVSFPRFARSVFISEQNPEYERLQTEYQARLSDTKLSAVDRERIIKEFEAKRDALSKSDYSINYLVAKRDQAIPEPVLRKVLTDVLQEWAAHAVNTRHAILYDVAVLSPRFVDVPTIDPANHIAALQLLRGKFVQVRQNLTEIGELPGAHLVRSRENSSLAELKLQLEDLVQFRIEPLLTIVRTSGLIENRAFAVQFMESQLAHDERRLQASERKADAIREALATYTASGSAARPADPASELRSTDALGRGNASEVIMPQISDSFVDRLLQMSNTRADQEYRQKLTEELHAANVAMIPLREAVEFDRQLLKLIRDDSPRVAGTTSSEVASQIEAVKSELRQLIAGVNEIYLTVSRNLNPATALYTVGAPPTTRFARTLSMQRLAMYGILVFLLSIPAILVACLLHHRIHEEEAETTSASSEYATASDPAG